MVSKNSFNIVSLEYHVEQLEANSTFHKKLTRGRFKPRVKRRRRQG